MEGLFLTQEAESKQAVEHWASEAESQTARELQNQRAECQFGLQSASNAARTHVARVKGGGGAYRNLHERVSSRCLTRGDPHWYPTDSPPQSCPSRGAQNVES